MHSPLTNKIILADPSNYTQGRQGYKVCKITPHHMAAIWTAERCAQSFQNPNRNASANYCIGYDGTIVCNVDENNRAWTSSNGVNDCQAITIEVANDTGAPTWSVSAAAWKSLVNLCADICKRYGFRLNFNGTPSGSLTMHKMFAATACPGPYLEARMGQLANEVNAILDGGSATNPSTPNGAYEAYNGFVEVTYGGSDGLVLHSKPSWASNTEAGVVKKGEVFTVVGRQMVDGVYMYKLKSGKWITSATEYVSFRTTLHANGSGGSASKPTTPSNPYKDADGYYKVGTPVCTGVLATASTGGKVYKGDWKGTITRVIKGAAYPYLLNNGTGWTNDSGIDNDPHTP